MADRTESDLLPEDDVYVSEEDEDFDPNAAHEDENISGSSESEAGPNLQATSASKGRRRPREEKEGEAEDAGFENSGDEGIIKKGKKRKRKGSVKDDSGGEGGFVQTRSMRAVA